MSDLSEMSEAEIIAALSSAVLSLEVQRTGELAQMVLDRGFSARRAILEGLAGGMRRVGEKFCAQDYFVPEVLVAARAMYRGMNLLKPRMLAEGDPISSSKGRIAIAVVEGDLHDIGKNIVKLMLEAEGFELMDLGKNVSAEAILAAIGPFQPQFLALSTLLTSTLAAMKRTVAILRENHPNVQIMVGGAPVSDVFAREIGADGTASDAAGAVKVALQLSGKA